MDENITILLLTCQTKQLEKLGIMVVDKSCFIGMFDDFKYFVNEQNQIVAKLYVKHRKYEHVVEIILH
jgi:hypothetical protein